MPRRIDADSHFMEPLDLWVRYSERAYRDRCLAIESDASTGGLSMRLEGQTFPDDRMTLQGLGIGVAYGQKERGRALGSFDASAVIDGSLEDMEARIAFLDREGFECQVLFPTLGLVWEGLIEDPELAAAHCRAYNRWALEAVRSHRDRLFPMGHISLRHQEEAVRELGHLVREGVRGVFVAALPPGGKSLGAAEFDPVWDAAQGLDLAVCLHLVVHPNYLGHDWHGDRDPGFMFLSMNCIQDPRMALTTMVYDGVFERFPRLRVATVEAASGWVVEWVDRLDYRYSYMGHTCAMERPASAYLERNIWISADPNERTLPFTLELIGDTRFFVGSDYPHAEGFPDTVKRTEELLSGLPTSTLDRVLGENAAEFFRI